MNVAWAMLWGGSRSTKPCAFPCKVAAAGDERYLVCVRRLRFGSFRVQSVPPMDFATSGCSCVRSSMRFLTLWWQIADFRNFGASDFPCKNPFKKSFKIVFFSLWRRDPVLELQFPTSLRVVLLCFSTQSL